MKKPENLPPELEPIRDAVIDYALGRTKTYPENIDDLYAWYESDGYGDEVNYIGVSSLIYLSDITDWLSDEEMGGDPDISDITDRERIDYAKRLINDQVDSISAYGALIKTLENSKGEQAFLGYLEQSQGMAGTETSWWGIYRSEDAFISELEKNEDFLTLDGGGLTDEGILGYWHT